MDFETLAEYLQSQGAQVKLDGAVLSRDILRTLEQLLGTDGLTVLEAKLDMRGLPGSGLRTRQRKLLHQWAKGAMAVGSGKIKPPDDLGLGQRDFRWDRFVRLSEELGIHRRDLRQVLLRYSNYKLAKMYRYTRETPRTRRQLTLVGTHLVRLGEQPPLPLAVTAIFRERRRDSQHIDYEVYLSGFPQEATARLVPGLTTPVWKGLLYDSPTLILASGPLNTMLNKTALPLEAGVNLVVPFRFAPNLDRLAGRPGTVFLCGLLEFRSGRTQVPEVRLSTYPACTFDLGVTALEKARLRLWSRWVDEGDEAPVEDSDDGQPSQDTDDVDGPVLETRVSVGGITDVDEIPAMLWSELPADTGMLVFHYVPKHRQQLTGSGYRFVRRPMLIQDLRELAPFAGGATDWLEAFPYPDVLKNGTPYELVNLSICYDLLTAVPVSVTIHVRSTRPFAVTGLDPWRVDPFEVAWTISFPKNQGMRSVYVTASGTLRAGSVNFAAAFAMPSFTIHAHCEDETLDLPAMLKQQPLASLHKSEDYRGLSIYQDEQSAVLAFPPDVPEDFTCSGLYMDLAVTMNGYKVVEFAAMDEDGREFAWR